MARADDEIGGDMVDTEVCREIGSALLSGWINMLETPILFAIGLLVLVGIVWWLYRSG
jgi:hypothetical protein